MFTNLLERLHNGFRNEIRHHPKLNDSNEINKICNGVQFSGFRSEYQCNIQISCENYGLLILEILESIFEKENFLSDCKKCYIERLWIRFESNVFDYEETGIITKKFFLNSNIISVAITNNGDRQNVKISNDCFDNLPLLDCLELRGVDLEGITEHFLSNSKKLSNLQIHRFILSEFPPNFLKNNTNLRSLYILGNYELKNEIPHFIKNLTNLQCLSMINCFQGNVKIEEHDFKFCNSLEVIHIEGCRIIKIHPLCLKRQKIRFLTLSNNIFDVEEIDLFLRNIQVILLRKLDLSQNKLKHLPFIPAHLKDLILSDCNKNFRNERETILSMAKNLEILDLNFRGLPEELINCVRGEEPFDEIDIENFRMLNIQCLFINHGNDFQHSPEGYVLFNNKLLHTCKLFICVDCIQKHKYRCRCCGRYLERYSHFIR